MLGSGGAGVAPSGGSRASVPRRQRGWKDSLPEFPSVLFSASRSPQRPPALPAPSCAFTIIYPPRNKLRRGESRWQSTREMPVPFGQVPLEHPSTGAREGSTRGVCGGVGHPPPPGHPRTPSQPPGMPGDGLGAEAGRHRHPARQALPRLPEAPATAGACSNLPGPR